MKSYSYAVSSLNKAQQMQGIQWLIYTNFSKKLSILNNFRYFHAINIQFVPQHCEKKSSPQNVNKTPKTRRVQNTLTTMAVNIAYLCRIFTSVTEINKSEKIKLIEIYFHLPHTPLPWRMSNEMHSSELFFIATDSELFWDTKSRL